MPLIELLYSSYTATGKQVDITELVNQAAQKNKIKGITGCLLASDSEFFQVLEGDRAEVMDLFNKIRNDSRHFGVNLIWSAEIKERAFGDWSMLCRKVKNPSIAFTGELTTGRQLFEIIRPEILKSEQFQHINLNHCIASGKVA